MNMMNERDRPGESDGRRWPHRRRGGFSVTVRSWLQGHRGWFMVYIAYVEMFLALGTVFNYSILFLSFQEFGKSSALTGWPGSLANGLLCAASPVSVPFLRRFGPRAATLLGAVLYCGGFIATSFVPALEYTYLTVGLFVGVGTNFVFQSVSSLVLDWFPEENCSRATALALLGPTCGMMVFAPLMNALEETYNWRNSLRIIGAGNLIISLTHAGFIVQPARKKPLTASDRGSYRSLQRDLPAEGSAADDRVQRPTPPLRRLAKILLRVDTCMWLLCLTLGNLGWSFILVNFAPFMEHDLHFNREQIPIAIVLFGVGEIIGKVALSVVGDHLPFLKLYVVAAASVLGGIASGLTTLVRTVSLMFTFSFCLGLFRAGSYGMPLAAAMEIFGDYGPDVVSTLVLMPWGFGVFIGAPLSGGLYDLTGDYTLSLLVIAAIFLCSAATVLVIPVRRRLQQRAGTLSFAERKTSVPVVCVSVKKRNNNSSSHL